MNLAELSELAMLSAPWIAGVLGIAAAIAGERAFVTSSDAVPPERWRGEDVFFGSGLDVTGEIHEKASRGSMRQRAAALQTIATYLAAGAAVEAAAASQHGVVAEVLVLLGVLLPAVFTFRRWVEAEREIAYTRAWFLRMEWSIPRKLIASSDPAIEAAEFAKVHPREARILSKRGH